MAMLSRSDIDLIGFKNLGENVQISDRASFYGVERIIIGSNVRIDDFCILSAGSGGIVIGSYVHIAAYSSLIGEENITLSDFAGLSSRVSVYSSSDDYSGKALTNPTVPGPFKAVKHSPVLIGRHVIVGAGSVILPGCSLGDGAAIGALSLVTRSCDPFTVYSGTPAKRIADRSKDLLEIERLFIEGA